MKKLLPVILAVVGLGVGIGAGSFLKPAPEPLEMATALCEGKECEAVEDLKPPKPIEMVVDPDAVFDYVKLPKQFVVPIIRNEKVRALVVLTLSLEVEAGTSDAVLAKAPRLRDAFLQVLFDHANSGGFDGAFTSGRAMSDLRDELKETARSYMGKTVESVLIEEIVKQSV